METRPGVRLPVAPKIDGGIMWANSILVLAVIAALIYAGVAYLWLIPDPRVHDALQNSSD
jgi:hypothetical protein